MKKISVFLCALFFTISLFSFANNDREPLKKITEAFKQDFPTAADVSWQTNYSSFQIARFNQNGRTQLAYYKESGEYVGLVWSEELSELPVVVKEEIVSSQNLQDIKSVFVFLPADESPIYYAIGEVDGKTITLEINLKGKSTIVRKKRIPIS